jgi:hypothetical protein
MQAYSESVSGLKRLRNDPQANTIACLIGVRGSFLRRFKPDTDSEYACIDEDHQRLEIR